MSHEGDGVKVEQETASGSGEYPRLPCRGCTDRCSNYDVCDGRPWRTLGKESSNKNDEA